MPEQQNIEYKTSWHDDNLKTICAFANSKGGKLFIGKDNNGNCINVADDNRLMEELPNKIKNLLGITAEVNLIKENSKCFIEIDVQPYSVAISLRGRYYIRSGSTTKELTGNSLTDFLLKKSGKTWDDVIEDRAAFSDIDENSIKKYLSDAGRAGRLPSSDDLNIPELLEKLRLAEGTKLKRAAIILFGKDPGKFYPNISVKIGRFGKSDDELKFQEVEEGNLLHLLKEVPLQLDRKFLTRAIGFEGLQRIEKGEYPVAALREMLLNALVHKNYSGSTIQLRVYDDKISFWNKGTLPEGLSFEALKRQHPSRPRNPIIADVCFKGGYIDAWGRGTLKIINACNEAELPEPEMKEVDGGFLVTVFMDLISEEELKKNGLNDRQIKAILFIKENGEITNSIYRKINNVGKTTAVEELQLLVEKKYITSYGTKGRGTKYIIASNRPIIDRIDR
ncbi:MAG: putative DNA binding domain-containing protein [Ignavibacteriales bacterium]|nr:putative DNA binding domain-containing protein [Ignavibacteriales bacterium]